jgi:hypothetical protein
MVRAERKHRHAHHRSTRSPHTSLDNRGRLSRAPPLAPAPNQARTTKSDSSPPGILAPKFDSGAPRIAADVISAACAHSASSSPFSIASGSPDPVVDSGSDVADLIAEAEQMDLEAEARRAGL